jgi:hypothetical protein
VLADDVMSNHSTPDIGSRSPLDTEAPFASVSADSLIYHVSHGFSASSIGFGRLEVAERFALGPAVIAGHVTWNALITCGGTYDTARNRYMDNVIVFAN